MGGTSQSQEARGEYTAMVGVTCAAFAQGVIDACAGSDKAIGCTVLLYDVPVVKFRVDMTDGSFIAVFYNADTGKVSFAWIVEKQRVFGADNTRGWHIHPLCDPVRHLEHPPMTFEEFLAEVEEHIQ